MPQGNLIVFGYDELLLATLDVARAAGLAVRAVVFPSNRLDHPHVPQIKSIVERRKLATLIQPPRRDVAPFVAKLAALEPDLILVWSYSMILPLPVVSAPRLGTVNVHMGLLPEYRGAHAPVWALVNGEAQSGVTLHYMDDGVDSGPVIDLARFPIQAEDDMVSLLRRGKAAGELLLERWLHRLMAERVPARPQDESRAHHYPPRDEADACIDWSADHVAIWNLVRSLVPPFPGAFTSHGERRVIVRKARAVGCREALEPGIVYDVSEQGIHVAAGLGAVVIEAVLIDGEKYAAGRLAAAGIRKGDRLGPVPGGTRQSEEQAPTRVTEGVSGLRAASDLPAPSKHTRT